MSLNEDQVRQVAHLARLAVSDEEVQLHAKNLSKILDLVEQMNAIDTTGVTPMAHPLEVYKVDNKEVKVQQPCRPDQTTEPNEREAMQEIAPNAKHGLYLVPQVIE